MTIKNQQYLHMKSGSFSTNLKSLTAIFALFFSLSVSAQTDTLHLYFHHTQTSPPDSMQVKIEKWAKNLGRHVDVDVVSYYHKIEFKKFSQERLDNLFITLNRKARQTITITSQSVKKGEDYQRTMVDLIYKTTITPEMIAAEKAKAESEAAAAKAKKDAEKAAADAAKAEEKAKKDAEKAAADAIKAEEKKKKDEEKAAADALKDAAKAEEKKKKDEEKAAADAAKASEKTKEGGDEKSASKEEEAKKKEEEKAAKEAAKAEEKKQKEAEKAAKEAAKEAEKKKKEEEKAAKEKK